MHHDEWKFLGVAMYVGRSARRKTLLVKNVEDIGHRSWTGIMSIHLLFNLHSHSNQSRSKHNKMLLGIGIHGKPIGSQKFGIRNKNRGSPVGQLREEPAFWTDPRWYEPICEPINRSIQCIIHSFDTLAECTSSTFDACCTETCTFSSVGPGDIGCPEELLSRHKPSATKDQDDDRKSRTPSSHILAGTDEPPDAETGCSKKPPVVSQGGKREPSCSMAQASRRDCIPAQGTYGLFQATTDPLWTTHLESKYGSQRGRRVHYRAQQTVESGCLSQQGGGRRWRPCLRFFGERPTRIGTTCKSSEDLTRMYRSHRRDTSCRFGGRGRGGRTTKTCSVQRSYSSGCRNWRCWRWSMMLGSVLQCLRNEAHVPIIKPFKSVRFAEVDAYRWSDKRPLDKPYCAASLPDFDIGHIPFHSIMTDPDCVFSFDAVRFAQDLHFECIQDDFQWCNDASPCDPKLDCNVCLNQGKLCTNLSTGIDKQVEPLSPSEAVWIPACPQCPQTTFPCRNHFIQSEYSWDLNLDYEVPGDEQAGVIPYLPTQPFDQQASWIRTIFAHWLQSRGSLTDSDQLQIRSWYLNPFRYMSTQVWRPILLPANFDDWWTCLRAVWHDMLEHDIPVDVFVVRPNPIRPHNEQMYPFDILICQQLEADPLLKPSLIVECLIGMNIHRLHTVARLLPAIVSAWELIYLNDDHRFCPGPSLMVDFHRKCEVWRDQQQIGPQLTPVNFGDCFTINIFPPSQIRTEDVDDDFGLMQQTVSHHLKPPLQQLRLDETSDIQQRITEIADQNDLLQDDLAGLNPEDLHETLRDLLDPWNEIAVAWTDRTRWAAVGVWYISHQRWRICTSYRTVWLSDQLLHWRDEILRSWEDQIDPDDSIDIAVVRPQPFRREPNLAAHILIIQHRETDTEHAGLVTLSDESLGTQVQRQALVLPTVVSHECLLMVANRLQDLQECIARVGAIRCVTKTGTFDLTREAVVGWPGLSYTVIIDRSVQYAPGAFTGPNVFPVALLPGAPRVSRALHDLIAMRRIAQPHNPINLRVHTWFLDHVRYQRCLYSRLVDLPLNPNLWLPTILQHWADQYDPNAPVDGHVVQPQPSVSQWQVEDVFHIIIEQHTLQDFSSILTTTFDLTRNAVDAPGIQRAFVAPVSVSSPDILRLVDLDLWCDDDRHDCRVHFGDVEILKNVPFPTHAGNSFRILFSDSPIPRWPIQETQQQQDESEHVELLQRKVEIKQIHRKPQQIQLQSLIPDACMKVSCRQALFLREQCLNISLGPISTRQAVVKWHEATIQELDKMPDWESHHEYPIGFHFFTDGTACRTDGKWRGASAVVLIVSTHFGDRFGGFRCHSDDAETTAPRAELAAMVSAVLWASELLQAYTHWYPFPGVSFNYDSLFAGNCANGTWATTCHEDLARPLRALIHWMLQRHGHIFAWNHIPAHTGHPWNEAADAIAWACHHSWIAGTPLKPVLDILTFDQVDFKTIEWLWLVEASLQNCKTVPRIVQDSFHVDLLAPFDHNPNVDLHSFIRNKDQPALCHQDLKLTLRCVTANVLTLYGNRAKTDDLCSGSFVSARQEALMKMCHENGYLCRHPGIPIQSPWLPCHRAFPCTFMSNSGWPNDQGTFDPVARISKSSMCLRNDFWLDFVIMILSFSF